MRCWRCDDRDEVNELGLCTQCDTELHTENTIPPGRQLHPPGTLPEDVGPYKAPRPSDYVTYPTGMPIEVEQAVIPDAFWRAMYEPRPALTEQERRERGIYTWPARSSNAHYQGCVEMARAHGGNWTDYL